MTTAPIVFSSCMTVPVISYKDGKAVKADCTVSAEVTTPLFLNAKPLGTLVSSPHDVVSLAAGYCLAAHYIPLGETIRTVLLKDGAVYVTTGPAGSTAAPSSRKFTISAKELCSYGDLLDTLSTAHHSSHGIHEGAIVCQGRVLAYAEDVSRHNVLDRLRGLTVLHHLDICQGILVFSGRVPQSVITRVHDMGLSLIASRAMPSSAAIQQAIQCGITLASGLRTDTFHVFAHAERIQF